jgi:hypothetical protein
MLFTFGFCGVGQVLDLLLLPDALNQTNLRLGFSKNNVAMLASPSRITKPVQQGPPGAMPSTQDDELDLLIQQAEQSVSRTNRINKDS